MKNITNTYNLNTFNFINMNNKFLSMLVLALAVFTYSCSSDDDGVMDTEDPVIMLNTPEDRAQFQPGEEIHIDVDFTDNVALSSYKIDIHWAGDGHSHRLVPMHDDHDHDHGEQFDFEETGELSGTEDHIHMHIEVPENAMHGPYHLGVIALDAAGNETTVFRDIAIGDYDFDHDHDHELQVDGFEILDRGHSPHQVILDAHGNHWHGSFSNGITLHATDNDPIPGSSSWYERGPAESQPEAVSLGVRAFEDHGDHTHDISIPGMYRLEAVLTHSGDEDILYISESHGDHVHFVGLADGHAHIVFQLVRQSDGEVVYTSPEFEFEVHDH